MFDELRPAVERVLVLVSWRSAEGRWPVGVLLSLGNPGLVAVHLSSRAGHWGAVGLGNTRRVAIHLSSGDTIGLRDTRRVSVHLGTLGNPRSGVVGNLLGVHRPTYGSQWLGAVSAGAGLFAAVAAPCPARPASGGVISLSW